ncbi:MAG: NTP transferase domain-containing protein [Promethearchaeota archaeon]
MNLISFVLLAGGPSTRMGMDKGLVKLGDKHLIEYVLNQIHEFLNLLNLENQIPIKICLHDYIQMQDYLNTISTIDETQIIIDEVVWTGEYSDIPQPEQSELLGVWAALTYLKPYSKYAFILPCDMPFISNTILSYMLDEYLKGNKNLFKLKESKNKTNNPTTDFKHSRVKNGGKFFSGKTLAKSAVNTDSNNQKDKIKKKIKLKRLKGKKEIKEIKKHVSYIPRWNNGKIEPFFGLYHIKSMQPVLEKKLLEGETSLENVLHYLAKNPIVKGIDDQYYGFDLHFISIEDQLAKYDKDMQSFIDINSAETLKKLESKIYDRKLRIK